MKQDLVFCETYKANGFVVYEEMPITEATGAFCTREDFGDLQFGWDYVHGTKLDLDQGNDVLHISPTNDMGDPLLVVRVDVAAIVAYLDKQLPTTKSAPVPVPLGCITLLVLTSPHLFRNFGFSYNQNKGGFVRIKQTVASKKVKPPYTKTLFNAVRQDILKKCLIHVETAFNINNLNRVSCALNNDANNVAVFLKKFITHPSEIQYTEYRYDNIRHCGILTPISFSSYLRDQISSTISNVDEVVPMLQQELQTWWDNATEVK